MESEGGVEEREGSLRWIEGMCVYGKRSSGEGCKKSEKGRTVAAWSEAVPDWMRWRR